MNVSDLSHSISELFGLAEALAIVGVMLGLVVVPLILILYESKPRLSR